MGFKRIETRLDSIDKNLSEHMKRTDLLEKKMHIFDDLVHDAHGAIKVLKIVGSLVAFGAAIAEIVRFFHP